MIQQTLYALRALRRSPGYTACSLLVLAIAIGATTTAVSVVGGVLLSPLSYRESTRLVALWSTVPSNPRTYPSYPDVRDWGAEAELFEATAYTRPFLAILAAGAGRESAVLNGSAVSPEFFTVMGARAVLGRLLSPADGAQGAAPAAVLSYAQWVGRFGADSAVLGQIIDLTDGSYAVVGVAAPEQTFPEWTITVKSDLYVPLAAVPSIRPILDRRDVRDFTRAVARLRPGVSVEAAGARLRQVAERLSAEYPEDDRGFGVRVMPLREDLVGDARPALLVLSAAVGFVLLLACGNVANLSLVRATARARDLAVRAALGAGRSRIIRQLLLESALLTTGGGLLGIVSATAAVRVLVGAAPVSIPRVSEIAVNGWALAATIGITALAALLSGLVPALVLARSDLF
nr:ABC transporter permease [Gemmatimonadales bacterium]